MNLPAPQELYPEIQPFNSGFVEVSHGFSIYFEESGNPKGVPVLYLHGGPGEGVNPKKRRLFNPKKFRVVMFDQRGCGKSTPRNELKGNEIQYLIDDIEALRKHLGIEKWWVTGASWGSTLGLAYSVNYPLNINGLVLNSIFLGYAVNVDWVHGASGAARIFPEHYEKYINFLPEEEREAPLLAYYKRLAGADEKLAMEAALQMIDYEGKILAMEENFLKEQALKMEANQSALETQKSASGTHQDASGVQKNAPKVQKTHSNEEMDAKRAFEQFAFTHSLLEAHYSVNNFFMEEDYILDRIQKIAHLPVVLIHGRYDMVCPVKNAYKLHQFLEGSKLTIVPNAAHSTSEMLSEVMSAYEAMAK